jgi:XRE family transcriptional regulator, regulator of sulfur utilization
MNISRRDLTMLLPVLATTATAQSSPKPAVLPSKVYHTEKIPYAGDDKKKGRRIFLGTTLTGFNLEMHETILGPGEISHPPHQHINEETIVIVEGTIDVFIAGKTETATAGSVTFFASNDLHNFRNVGALPCRYYVLELRADAA